MQAPGNQDIHPGPRLSNSLRQLQCLAQLGFKSHSRIGMQLLPYPLVYVQEWQSRRGHLLLYRVVSLILSEERGLTVPEDMEADKV